MNEKLDRRKIIAVTDQTEWRTQIHHYRNFKGIGAGLYSHSQATNQASALAPSMI